MEHLIPASQMPEIPAKAKETPFTHDAMCQFLFGLPPEWRAESMEAINFDTPHVAVKYKGSVYPPKTRGKNKGQPNWRKPDPEWKRELVVTKDMRAAWEAHWESQTGLCFQCKGTRYEFARWTKRDGSYYRHCKKCSADKYPKFAKGD